MKILNHEISQEYYELLSFQKLGNQLKKCKRRQIFSANFHFFEKNEVNIALPHVFRCETPNEIVDFPGCSLNFYILSKLGGFLSSILTENTKKIIFGLDLPPPQEGGGGDQDFFDFRYFCVKLLATRSVYTQMQKLLE